MSDIQLRRSLLLLLLRLSPRVLVQAFSCLSAQLALARAPCAHSQPPTRPLAMVKLADRLALMSHGVAVRRRVPAYPNSNVHGSVPLRCDRQAPPNPQEVVRRAA